MNKRIAQLFAIAGLVIATFTLGRADTRMVPIPIDDDLNIIIPIEVGAAIATLSLADAALTNCIKAAGTANGWKNVADVTSLSCANLGITNIAGIEQFNRLRALDLSGNTLGSVSLLAGLSQLADLTLTNTAALPLTGASFNTGFAGLKNLTIYTNGELDASLSTTLDTRFTNQARVSVVTAAIPAATAVGNTPGSFSVSPSGAATYSIPIAVPPGAAGMQPSLSLAYSSQSGNGLLGVGFSLQGLSAITRCPKTMATEGDTGGVNLTTNDRFCLDGQKLILVGGTYGAINSEYRTELDTFTKVTAYGTAGNGPSYFIAQTKSGQILYYGNTADSQILATGKTTAVVWNVNRIADTVGNFMTVTYVDNTSTGEYYPQRIDYAGNTNGTVPSSSVQFIYTTRSDVSIGYVGGSTITNAHRLTNVWVSEGSNSIRDYRLTYDSNQANTSTKRSRLISVSECDSNLSTAKCLPPATFAWSTDGVGFSTAAANTGILSYNNNAQYTMVMDVGGNGTSDLVNCVNVYNGGYLTYSWQISTYSSNTGFASGVPTGQPCPPTTDVRMLDFYERGLTDILTPEYTGAFYNIPTGNWSIRQQASFTSSGTGVANTGYDKNPQLIDINGDGRADLAFVDGAYWNVRLNVSKAFSATATISAAPSGNYQYAQPIDYNGDGKMDLLVPGSLGGSYTSANWYVLQSTGPGFTVVNTFIPNTGYTSAQLLDVNGDGRVDLVYNSGTYWAIRYNTGAGFSATATLTAISSTKSAYARQTDYNGDGRMDLIVPGPLGGYYVSAQRTTGLINCS